MPEFTELHRKIAETLYEADRPLTAAEIAEKLGLDEEEVAEALPLVVKVGFAKVSYYMDKEGRQRWREWKKTIALINEMNEIFEKEIPRTLTEKPGKYIPEIPTIPKDWQKTTIDWLFPDKAKTKDKERENKQS